MPQTIDSWLREAGKELKAVGIESFVLDSELLLAHELGCERVEIHTHPERELDQGQTERLEKMLVQRRARIPLPYIVGYKEFYGRTFAVTRDVLIPRPETETLVDVACGLDNIERMVDVGAGSGCIGITLKLERPEWDVIICDKSKTALRMTKRNALELHSSVSIVQSDLLTNVEGSFDLIVANLPYVDRTWEVAHETKHEPPTALFADDGGLEPTKRLLIQAKERLRRFGYVAVETDVRQHTALIDFAKKESFRFIRTEGLANLFCFGD